MPWYYAGPGAKPLGPVTLDELQALQANGAISPDTYVLEYTEGPKESLAWKRYRDSFPAFALPPLPPVPGVPSAVPLPAPAIPQPHPLFPSAAAVPGPQPSAYPTGSPHDPYSHVRRNNIWCLWGFFLGLAGILLSIACVGLIPALISLPLCVVGLVQVHRHREQAGQGLAIAGLVLSSVAAVISLLLILSLAMPILKAHGLTVTEQTTNDSE
jgi:hypothetical protein